MTSAIRERVLVTGWFSFEEMGASAGDIYARDLVCQWLEQAGLQYDLALAAPLPGGVDWRAVYPDQYSHLVFVCGPFGNGRPITELIQRFGHTRLIGLNVSMLDPIEDWNPFELLLERDSSGAVRPDMAFLTQRPLVPVDGAVLIGIRPEYGTRDKHEHANVVIRKFLASHDISVIDIDTRLDRNKTGQASAVQIESLIARMDVVFTTRLHGLVLSLKKWRPGGCYRLGFRYGKVKSTGTSNRLARSAECRRPDGRIPRTGARVLLDRRSSRQGEPVRAGGLRHLGSQ